MAFPADDRYMRFTFSDTKRTAGLLREFLPQEIIAQLDLTKLTRIHEQQIFNNLQETRDDLNMLCPLLNGGSIYIRILIEHKSAHAPKLWTQLMKSICTHWEQNLFQSVIPVVLHTGPEPFHFETPQSALQSLPKAIFQSLPSLEIYPIDLGKYPESQLWESTHLDHVSKVTLSILKLSQDKILDIAQLRRILKKEWPSMSAHRRNRYIWAAISYIKRRIDIPSQEFLALRSEMISVHGIHPNSPLAQEMREDFQKGVEVGMEQGQRLLDLKTLDVIQGMLAKGCDWSFIESITHLDQQAFDALQGKYGKSPAT